MREKLIAELAVLKESIVDANRSAYTAAVELQVAKNALQGKEDALLMGKVPGASIDGKNAEIRAAQLREHTAAEREAVFAAEETLEGVKTRLANLRAELQINLALVELVREVA